MWAWVLILVGAAAFIAWFGFATVRLERLLLPWLPGRVRGSTVRAALLGAGLQMAALLACSLLSLATIPIAEAAGDPRWGAVTVVPAVLLYAPFSGLFIPSESFGFAMSIRAMEGAGITRSQARAFLWSGVPFTFLGLAVLTAGLLYAFAS